MSTNPEESGAAGPGDPPCSRPTPRTVPPSRVVQLAQACTQIANGPDADAVFRALEAALLKLCGPTQYGLWRRCSPDTFERLDPVAPAARALEQDADGRSNR